MITIETPVGDVAMLCLKGSRLGVQGYCSGVSAIKSALDDGARTILIDVGRVKRLAASDIARFIELAGQALPFARLALINAGPGVFAGLATHRVDQILPLFASLDRALEDPEIKSGLLAHTPAVVLCAGKGTRMAPLTELTPKPMLPIMGRPVLEHILMHLGRFGVRDILLNPGHLGPQISAHFEAARRKLGQTVFYRNEGRFDAGRWTAAPIGSASTLARWAADQNGLMTDTIVLCGDALVDIDLAAMMAHHRRTGADVTIAAQRVAETEVQKYGIMVPDRDGKVLCFQEKPDRDAARSTLANTGIYILSPRVAGWLLDDDGADIGGDLLPRILADGGHLSVFDQPFQWVDIGCGRDYMTAWCKALACRVNGISPMAEQIAPGIWVEEGVDIARLKDIEGPVYIGANTRIARGASIRGPVSVGRSCVIEAGAFLRHSILWSDTKMAKGALVDGLIASGHWAVSHSYADGSLQPRAPVDGVTSLVDTLQDASADGAQALLGPTDTMPELRLSLAQAS